MKQEIFISKKKINEDSPFIIAEAGVNHNGSLSIAKKLIQKAKIDGAEGYRLWIHIILPIVLPFAIVIILVEAVGALNVFPLIETMTAGGPFFSSEVMEIYIFRTAFVTDSGTMPRLGYACAAGVFWGVAVLFITVLQGLWMRKTRRI